ncbi:DNA polymerase III subunit delta [Desulfatirhabdium butyrativorans]|uniref:DNA polymerase III subunit delta n=1 Tax=Desulfatirhabdium butyrativorans TaxID=340467 RepID=UPI000401697F|nr:hypothetical protein [Desulfatirhabdium butyrativorans]
MAELFYRAFPSYLKSLHQDKDASPFAPVYLLHGDEMLYKSALDDLLDTMMTPEDRITRFESMEGIAENLFRAIESIQTFSFFPGIKVIGFLDTNIFTEHQEPSKTFSKLQEALSRQDSRSAAHHLGKLLDARSLTLDSAESDILAIFTEFGMSEKDRSLLSELLAYARQHRSGDGMDSAIQLLEKELMRGFPEGHHLILTAEAIDRRKSLYKRILEKGVVVDCSVPKDVSTKASRQAMEPIVDGEIQRVLSGHGKRLSGQAKAALIEKTGYHLRTIASELAKLVQYTGNRKEITAEDIRQAVTRSKTDPIYVFTNALTDKNLPQALSALDALLNGDLFPPQIIAAMHNQVRKMIVIRSFLDKTGVQGDMDFNTFQNRILPQIQAFDDALQLQVSQWHAMLSPPDEHPPSRKSKKTADSSRKTESVPGLMKKGQNPYPVFLLLNKVHRFTLARLVRLLQLLGEADEKLKSGTLHPRAVLEHVVMAFCIDDAALTP